MAVNETLRSLGSKLNCWFLFINHLWMKAVDCSSMTLKTGDGRAVKAHLCWGLNIDRPAGSCCSQSLVLTLSLTRLQQLRFSSQTQPWGRSAHWLPVYCSPSERWLLRQVQTFSKNVLSENWRIPVCCRECLVFPETFSVQQWFTLEAFLIGRMLNRNAGLLWTCTSI